MSERARRLFCSLERRPTDEVRGKHARQVDCSLAPSQCGRKCVGLPVSPSLRRPSVSPVWPLALRRERGKGREGEEEEEEAAAVSLCVGERRSDGSSHRGARAFFVEAGSTDRRLQTDSEPTIAFGGRGRPSLLPPFIPPSPSSASVRPSVLFLSAEYALLIRRRRRRRPQ